MLYLAARVLGQTVNFTVEVLQTTPSRHNLQHFHGKVYWDSTCTHSWQERTLNLTGFCYSELFSFQLWIILILSKEAPNYTIDLIHTEPLFIIQGAYIMNLIFIKQNNENVIFFDTTKVCNIFDKTPSFIYFLFL